MRTLWVGLVFAFGCSSNTVRPVLDASVSTCNLANPRANSLQVPLVVEGEQTAIEIESPRLPCPGDILGVTVEVFDAQNLPVEVTTGFHDNAVTVQFKPTSAGLWFFHVNFLPSQGTVQFSMPVAAKRPRDAAVVETFPIDMTACTVLARTARGGVACELTDAMTTHFFRGGVEETSFPGRGLAAVGNVLSSAAATPAPSCCSKAGSTRPFSPPSSARSRGTPRPTLRAPSTPAAPPCSPIGTAPR
jgi:hypothetical protein